MAEINASIDELSKSIEQDNVKLTNDSRGEANGIKSAINDKNIDTQQSFTSNGITYYPVDGGGYSSTKPLNTADTPVVDSRPIPAKPETIDTLLTQVRTNAEGKNTAYSKGAVGDSIIEGSDFDNFTKDDLREGLGRPYNGSAKWHTFPGVEDGGNGRLVITDSETYIRNLEAVYGAKKEVLNDRTKQLIIDSISKNNTYSAMNGLPGTHAEVRTYNSITSDYPNIADSQISIATVRGGNKDDMGADFPACTNCNSILPDDMNIPTGIVPIQSMGTAQDSNGLYKREE